MLLGILDQKTLLKRVCNIITIVFVKLILYIVVQFFFYPMQLFFQKIGSGFKFMMQVIFYSIILEILTCPETNFSKNRSNWKMVGFLLK
jgi:hypothetical protein